MNQQKYIEDLADIKDIMNRSSRFISLSGLSGISAGVVALLGASAAYYTVYAKQDGLNYGTLIVNSETILQLIGIAFTTLVVALALGLHFTQREAKKKGQHIWDGQAKRLLLNLAIPLVSGGAVCLILLLKGYIGPIAPLTLVFYGLALVNASKYTLNDIRSLGVVEIVLGLVSLQFMGYGLLAWALGFGLMHIVYGIVMYRKYKS
jgi:hypothetical protein